MEGQNARTDEGFGVVCDRIGLKINIRKRTTMVSNSNDRDGDLKVRLMEKIVDIYRDTRVILIADRGIEGEMKHRMQEEDKTLRKHVKRR